MKTAAPPWTDGIYLDFGADSKVEGVGQEDKIKAIRKNAIRAGLKLVDCPIRHLGTEKAQEIYGKIQDYLQENGVEILFQTSCLDLRIEDNVCVGVEVENERTHEKSYYEGEKIVVAAGRVGADWLQAICAQHDIEHVPGTVDVGVRVEVRNEIMEEVNSVLYESKLIGYPEPWGNKVRTFCQNPGGFVSQENYNNDLALVNGHSYNHARPCVPAPPAPAAGSSSAPAAA